MSQHELETDPQTETVDVGEQPKGTSGQRFTIHERERRREFARQYLALILLVLFAVTIGWVLYVAQFGTDDSWTRVKEALLVLLPVEASLLGSALSFYLPRVRAGEMTAGHRPQIVIPSHS